jgi:uncharacterized Zn finger protein (UPF0148 family)
MALTAFCPTCQRTVYIEKDDTPVCPVCSSPLLETVNSSDDEDDASSAAAEAQTPGST